MFIVSISKILSDFSQYVYFYFLNMVGEWHFKLFKKILPRKIYLNQRIKHVFIFFKIFNILKIHRYCVWLNISFF